MKAKLNPLDRYHIQIYCQISCQPVLLFPAVKLRLEYCPTEEDSTCFKWSYSLLNWYSNEVTLLEERNFMMNDKQNRRWLADHISWVYKSYSNMTSIKIWLLNLLPTAWLPMEWVLAPLPRTPLSMMHTSNLRYVLLLYSAQRCNLWTMTHFLQTANQSCFLHASILKELSRGEWLGLHLQIIETLDARKGIERNFMWPPVQKEEEEESEKKEDENEKISEPTWEDQPAKTRLLTVLTYLRMEHFYCLHCGCQVNTSGLDAYPVTDLTEY